MKWSSHPGASAGTKASSRATPERAIAALKQSSWRCVAAVPLDLIGPLTMMRSRDLPAFDVSKEPAAVQAAYGDHDFGRGAAISLLMLLMVAAMSVVYVRRMVKLGDVE